ncbi:hypothetical protein ACOSQ3_031034 [Xanthoceras sorbifolium]
MPGRNRSWTPGRKQIENARKNTDRDQDSRSRTAQKIRSHPTKKKGGTKLLGARSNNSKLPWPLLTEAEEEGPRKPREMDKGLPPRRRKSCPRDGCFYTLFFRRKNERKRMKRLV